MCMSVIRYLITFPFSVVTAAIKTDCFTNTVKYPTRFNLATVQTKEKHSLLSSFSYAKLLNSVPSFHSNGFPLINTAEVNYSSTY